MTLIKQTMKMNLTKFFVTVNLLLLCISISMAQAPECPAETYSPKYFGTTINETPQESPPTNPSGPPPTSENRGIYWVHGLGGGPVSWAEARTASQIGTTGFPARKVFGTLPTYVQTSLGAAGLDLQELIKSTPLVPDPSLNFIIAHSQGGLVSRKADEIADNYPIEDKNFFGIVTFGTPHGGAKILNSYADGHINEFTEGACKAILTGPAFEIADNLPALITFFINENNITAQTINNVCGAAATALPFALSDLLAGTTNDFYVGATPLDDLNAYNSTVHKAAFVGLEYKESLGETPSDPKQLFWRTMSNFQDNSTGPAFSKDDDDKYVELANELLVNYNAEYHPLSIIVESMEAQGFPCQGPWEWLFLGNGACLWFDQIKPKRDAYREAIYWLKNADNQWKGIIGSRGYGTYTENACECQVIDFVNGWSEPNMLIPTITDESACDNAVSTNPNQIWNSCDWVPYQFTGLYNYPSDGIVTYNSASAFPGVTYVNEMPETNHFQMRNSSETRVALNNLFNGFAGDSWFFTELK